MRDSAQMLKILAADFARAPMQTFAGIGRRFWMKFRMPAQVIQLREATRETPLILQIETTNVCNSACFFCAYPKMKRKKGVMGMPLFEKIVRDYSEMGGGPVSLTPLVGDALLDPHLMDRLRILEARPEINQITLTTNAIALDRYSDEDIRAMLKALYCIQVSVGGLDAATYKTMYGVDQLSRVRQAVERLLELGRETPQPAANITLAFRTNDWKFEKRFRRQIDEYRRRGVFVSHICAYANYSGIVKNDERRNLVVIRGRGQKRWPCIYASVAMSVCWDGRITACGCADYEGDKLMIGEADRDALSEVWSGERRTGIIESFEKGSLPLICRPCSAYQSDEVFARPFFKGAGPHRPLPLDFFHELWGG